MAAAMSVGQKHSDCLDYLQSLGDELPKEVADKLAAQINEEVNIPDICNINQAALNVTFRVYYHVLHKYELEDKHFADLPQRLSCEQPHAFLMLQSVLLTNHWSRLDAQLLEAKCIDAILAALQQNNNSLVHQLKSINLLVKKFPKLNLLPLKLQHFYQCLQRQSQVGCREETLTLFNHCCKDKERAFLYFRIIVAFWPWTNRNKYYLLSGILNSHLLPELLAESDQNESEFFAGLRLSLSYKGLRAASQYPVKSLSTQRSPALLALAVELLINGSVAEIQNFHSQWFLRIQQRDALFQMLLDKPEIVDFLASSEAARTASEQQRFILIFSMFAKEIYATSKVHFFKISTELLTNCSTFETDAQLLIFKFLVDNLNSFAVEDCLEFFNNFMQRHRSVESAEFRNTMLGKMPNIINHTAKHLNRVLNVGDGIGIDALAHDILQFFEQLQKMVEQDISCDVYQPRIFALKMLEILHKSIYSSEVIKNAKMCKKEQNQQLGCFLIDRGVFQPRSVAEILFKSLNNPQGFDDALELTVQLLLKIGHVDREQCKERCFTLSASSDVDECALVSVYAQLAVRSFPKDQIDASALYVQCMQKLTNMLNAFELDPLLTTKRTDGHLFGHINMLNELISVGFHSPEAPVADLLILIERISYGILKFLNLANTRRKLDAGSASFQDMDESLRILIKESSYTGHEPDETFRKYLLMSFWLTLKASCNLATSLGCALLRENNNSQHDYDSLQRCLDINVAVLTRCRHKGAIEAAGLSIGKLTRAFTSKFTSEDQGFQLLHKCLERELLSDCREVSTTRRGAGFSIMLLHVLKNDDSRQRLLLHRIVQHILHKLNTETATEPGSGSTNLDRWEALSLHYLCMLVRDTELRPAMCKYYNEIMLVCIAHIDTEWTISNGALQLFGATLGKLLGQRQATEFDTKLAWEPSEMNYEELACVLPKAFEHMLQCCDGDNGDNLTSSIILFLGFLSKVEHLCTTRQEQLSTPLMQRFRCLSFRLLQHRCQQVRRLAATCFVRAHEFRCDLSLVLLANAKQASQQQTDNFYEGLIYTLHAGVLKLQHEACHVWRAGELKHFQQLLLNTLQVTKQVDCYKTHTLNVLLKFLHLLDAKEQLAIVWQVLEERSKHNES